PGGEHAVRPESAERVHVRRIEQVVHGEDGGDGEVGTLERGGNGKPPRRVGVRRYLLRQRGAVLAGDERGAEARLDVARRAEGIDPVLDGDLEASRGDERERLAGLAVEAAGDVAGEVETEAVEDVGM